MKKQKITTIALYKEDFAKLIKINEFHQIAAFDNTLYGKPVRISRSDTLRVIISDYYKQHVEKDEKK